MLRTCDSATGINSRGFWLPGPNGAHFICPRHVAADESEQEVRTCRHDVLCGMTVLRFSSLLDALLEHSIRPHTVCSSPRADFIGSSRRQENRSGAGWYDASTHSAPCLRLRLLPWQSVELNFLETQKAKQQAKEYSVVRKHTWWPAPPPRTLLNPHSSLCLTCMSLRLAGLDDASLVSPSPPSLLLLSSSLSLTYLFA
ncbi:hypothetical protein BJX76DRAFT_116075 [Aspergillus varians]